MCSQQTLMPSPSIEVKLCIISYLDNVLEYNDSSAPQVKHREIHMFQIYPKYGSPIGTFGSSNVLLAPFIINNAIKRKHASYQTDWI